MRVEISEEPITILEDYARIPILFEVRLVLDISNSNNFPGEFELTERMLDVPYEKDYDATDGGSPLHWTTRFDMSNWGLFAAREKGRRVGGAVVAFKTPELNMLEDRADVALLWDIRVLQEARGHGVGSALFQAAEKWAKARDCTELKIETQNINLPACRFYERQGCVLVAVNRLAYPEFPDETQLLWDKDLSEGA